MSIKLSKKDSQFILTQIELPENLKVKLKGMKLYQTKKQMIFETFVVKSFKYPALTKITKQIKLVNN